MRKLSALLVFLGACSADVALGPCRPCCPDAECSIPCVDCAPAACAPREDGFFCCSGALRAPEAELCPASSPLLSLPSEP